MTTIISGDIGKGCQYWGIVAKMKRDYAQDNAGLRNINTAIPITRMLSDTDSVRIRMRNREPFAIIFANGSIGITFANLSTGGNRLFFDDEYTLDTARSLADNVRNNSCGGFYWVSRDKKQAWSAFGPWILRDGVQFTASTDSSLYVVRSVCPVPTSDTESCKILFGEPYRHFAYVFLESYVSPGFIALVGMYTDSGIGNSGIITAPLSWVSSASGAICQWHDSSSFLLASRYTQDLSYPIDTDKTSAISTVIGSISGAKQANLVSISSFIPTVTDSGFSVVESLAFSYPLYDQIALTGGVGTVISSGINGTGALDFPSSSNASYILPLGMDEDVLSFYVTEVSAASYSDTNVVVAGPSTNNFKAFDTTVTQSVNVLNVIDGTLIEKIPFGSPIIKHSLISTYPNSPGGPSVVVEDINMNFVTPLYMSAMFKVFLYTKSSYVSNRTLTNGVVTAGTATRTHNLYITYNGVEHLVATGVILNPAVVFPGENINVKTTGGNRVELLPDLQVCYPFAGASITNSTFMNNGVGAYGAELKDLLVISLNRNEQTLFLNAGGTLNNYDAVVTLLAESTFVFEKTLTDPSDTLDRYSYGVGRFNTELTDSSNTFYSDSIFGYGVNQVINYSIAPTVRNL